MAPSAAAPEQARAVPLIPLHSRRRDQGDSKPRAELYRSTYVSIYSFWLSSRGGTQVGLHTADRRRTTWSQLVDDHRHDVVIDGLSNAPR